MTTALNELKNIIETALLSSDAPLSPRELQSLFPAEAKPERKDIDRALEALQTDCASRPVELRKIGKGFRYYTRDQYAPWLRKLQETRPPRYSRALLETLAIIAYRQPVSRGDIEDIRGVSVSTDIVRVLLEREWIKQVGYRDVPGRPALFGTTPQFLEYFNLESLKELPELMDQRDMGEIAKELNLELPAMDTVSESVSEIDESIEASQAADEAENTHSALVDFSTGELPPNRSERAEGPEKDASVVSLDISRSVDIPVDDRSVENDETESEQGFTPGKTAEGSGA